VSDAPKKDEFAGLEEVDDGIWGIIYYTVLSGRIDVRDGKITGAQSVKDLPDRSTDTTRTGNTRQRSAAYSCE
jgi:hypothetical protein